MNDLRLGTDSLSEFQVLPPHTFFGRFVPARIGQVMTLSAGDVPPHIENATAAPAVRANEPLAGSAEIAGSFSKSHTLLNVAPPDMDGDDEIVAVAVDPGVEGALRAHFGDW